MIVGTLKRTGDEGEGLRSRSQSHATLDANQLVGLSSAKAALLRHALALAADEHAGHLVRGLAGFRDVGVGAVPAGMIRVVASGLPLPALHCPQDALMHDHLVRSRGPALVHKEFDRLGGSGGRVNNPTSVAIFCSFDRVSRRMGSNGRR